MKVKKYAGIVLLLTSLIVACSDSDPVASNPSPDGRAVEANNLAVGLMGKFEYAQAHDAFLELAQQWPDWLEARVNLAIATLNRQSEGDEQRALELVRQVLQADPSHLRAHYVAGLMQLYLGESANALQHFETVAAGDPADAYAAYYLAQCLAQQEQLEQSLSWYRRAMEADPYLRSAYYGAFQISQRLGLAEEAAQLAGSYQRLEANPRSRLAEFKYTRMGDKAMALAVNTAQEAVRPAPQGPLFTGPDAIDIDGLEALKWQTDYSDRALGITTADMQGDGLPDLFLTGAVEVDAGDGASIIGNLVLEGQSGETFQVIADHPLAAIEHVNTALWGDFDNDGLVDVYLCRRGENQLWRQEPGNQWRDITAASGTGGGDLDTVDGAFFDADHDGDLDLYLVNADGPNELLNNNLDGSFRPLAEEYGLTAGDAGSTMVLPVDLDNDRDADLVVLNARPPHWVYVNDRLWSYRPAAGYEQFNDSPALSVIAQDIDADGLMELYTLDAAGEVRRWRHDADGQLAPDSLGTPEVLNEAAAMSLASHDINGDGNPDLVVSGTRGWAVFSVGENSLELLYQSAAPQIASLPYLGTSLSGPGMLALPAATNGLSIWQPGPGRYPFLTLAFSGRQDNAQSMRSNVSGVGTHVAVRTASRWSRLQNFRRHSAPGQSLQPLAVGLQGADKADFISIDWSDGVFQSEINVATGRLHQITETQRQLSSCPVLFAWDGQEYRFVSDVLGVGGMGYATGPGEYSTPRPWENFLLPPGLLQPRGDRYQLKIAEPMEEIAYLDAARLAIYDLPPGWRMVMDERMGISAPEPTGQPRFYKEELLPVSASNERGSQVLESVLAVDSVAAPVGALDPRFIGRLYNEHVLDLEFPRPIDSSAGEATLVIDGWVEYPYSQTNFSAWQAGAAFEAPSLEAATAEGDWQPVAQQFGYPAGMPRRMSLPLAGLPEGTVRLRLRTNMQVYWDRIAVAYAASPPEHHKQVLPVVSATMKKSGFALRSNLDQFRPHYDYASLQPFWDTRYMSGLYTRLGSVEELVADIDDAVAIIGPGEEVHLEFDAVAAPPAGWSRFIVLESNGWAKDMDLYTRDGETVGPLPTTGKPVSVRDGLHARFNTRYQGGL